MAALNYADDRAFATARRPAHPSRLWRAKGRRRAPGGRHRRGGWRRGQPARDGAWDAALRFAERRRIGPFAAAEPDRAVRDSLCGDASGRSSG
jgi:regulatory protein